MSDDSMRELERDYDTDPAARVRHDLMRTRLQPSYLHERLARVLRAGLTIRCTRPVLIATAELATKAPDILDALLVDALHRAHERRLLVGFRPAQDGRGRISLGDIAAAVTDIAYTPPGDGRPYSLLVCLEPVRTDYGRILSHLMNGERALRRQLFTLWATTYRTVGDDMRLDFELQPRACPHGIEPPDGVCESCGQWPYRIDPQADPPTAAGELLDVFGALFKNTPQLPPYMPIFPKLGGLYFK
jgi:hypothetical protein